MVREVEGSCWSPSCGGKVGARGLHGHVAGFVCTTPHYTTLHCTALHHDGAGPIWPAPPFPPQVFGWLQDIKGNWMEVPDLELFFREHQ